MTLVPVTQDAAELWKLWVVEGSGEGIVLKRPDAIYQPGVRSPAWLKLKAKFTLEVTVTGGSDEAVPWADWGAACQLELSYAHPRTGAVVAIEEESGTKQSDPDRAAG